MMYSNRTILKKVFALAKPYRFHLALSFFLSLLATPIALLKPIVLKILIDNGFNNEPMPGYIRFFFPSGFHFSFGSVAVICTVLVVLIAVIDNVNALVTWVLNTYVGEKLVLKLRTLLFNHVQRLSLSYHDEKGTTHSLYRIQWDTTGVRTLLLNNISPFITAVLTLVGMVTVMFFVNWMFALISLCIIPLLYVLTQLSSKRLRRDWDQVKNDENSAVSIINEVLSSVRIVKAFGREHSEVNRFEGTAGKAVKGQVKIAWIAAIYSGLIGILFACGTALFIYFGAGLVKSGQMTIGDLTLVLAYLAQIYAPLHDISKIVNDVQSSFSSLDRVFILLDQEKEVKEDPHAMHLLRAKGGFEFRDISFAYNPEKETLKNISFTINPGDRVGIIGSTGSGKSTLVSLLTRFYDPTSGSILLDGGDIRKYKLADYRDQFGIVLQEPVLFSTTISENIRYGNADATDEEVIAAAKAANAHEFILRTLNGYGTIVGERGVTLSGGERQRISIARAFIKNAPVLILDEPTSSVDIKTEGLIMEAMSKLMENRTTFMITHRLDTLRSCNVILHLDHGVLTDLISDNNLEAIEEKKRKLLNSIHT